MKILLDTNTFIARLNGDERVATRLHAFDPEEIVLCAPVLAELQYGAEFSDRRDSNLERIAALAEGLSQAPFDAFSALHFARIKADLRRRGISKSDFDLAIVAIALSLDAVLVSNDRALLDGSIPDLKFENWLAPAGN